MASQLPDQRPLTPLLDRIDSPADLTSLSFSQLEQLAAELRSFMLYTVGQTGGHLGAGLGVVELTIALLRLLKLPEDQLIWDVGHQSYPHKILTGRRDAMLSMRQKGGLAPFPHRDESPFDSFGTGHSSTSISAALGMAIGARLQGKERHCVAVIGDGALTAGMAFEALNHAAHERANLLVILNDNAMSISPNTGGLATYLAGDRQSQDSSTVTLFESLNFRYRGPINGHDLKGVLLAIEECLNSTGPQFLHLRTQKGRGFNPAERDPVRYHAVAKIAPKDQPPAPKSFSNCFSEWLVEQAYSDDRVVAITPAMREGSDLIKFSEQFPKRFFDVAIAEQHAATLAAGFACSGMKPVLAIYSTFLQRAYDQVVHDIALQNLDVLIAIDRAGLVGEDGASHGGLFDLSMLLPLPNVVVMTPATAQEQQLALTFGLNHAGPAAVRYPRGSASSSPIDETDFELGKGRIIRRGKRTAILNFGALLEQTTEVAHSLDASLADMRFAKPLDLELIEQLAVDHELLVCVEDHAIISGVGAQVSSFVAQLECNVKVLCLGVPDEWLAHGSRSEQLEMAGLNTNLIASSIQAHL